MHYDITAMTLKPKPYHSNGKRFVTIEELKENELREKLCQ